MAAAIPLCLTRPPRTTIDEIVMTPTVDPDRTVDIAVARAVGAPEDA